VIDNKYSTHNDSCIELFIVMYNLYNFHTPTDSLNDIPMSLITDINHIQQMTHLMIYRAL